MCSQITQLGGASSVPCVFCELGKNWLYFHEQRVYVFSSVKSGVRTPPPHWVCGCPRGPALAFPSFPVLLSEVFHRILGPAAWFHSSSLPPTPRSSLLHLPHPSSETLASPLGVLLGARSLPLQPILESGLLANKYTKQNHDMLYEMWRWVDVRKLRITFYLIADQRLFSLLWIFSSE